MNGQINPELKAQLTALGAQDDWEGFKRLLRAKLPEICRFYDLTVFKAADLEELFDCVSAKVSEYHEYDNVLTAATDMAAEWALSWEVAIRYALIEELMSYTLDQTQAVWEKYYSRDDAYKTLLDKYIDGYAYEAVKDLSDDEALQAASWFITGIITALFNVNEWVTLKEELDDEIDDEIDDEN